MNALPEAGIFSRKARVGSLRRLRRLRTWTLVVISLLTAAFMTGLGLEYRQLQAARSSIGFTSDYTVWAFFQAEVEALNLRDRLTTRLAEQALDPASDDELRRAFEILASRITLIRPERAIAGLPVLDGQKEAVADLDAFVARFDPWLAETSRQAVTPDVAREAVAALGLLRPRLRRLCVDIQHMYGEVAAQRASGVQMQIRMSIILSLVQVAMLVLFVGLLTVHLRALGSRQRRLLETLRSLREAQRASRRASEAKTRFLANMSHEIRTPLQGVLGQLSLLQGEKLPAEPLQHVRVAHESAQQLLSVLNDVIDITRIEAGRVHVIPAPCRPAEVVAQVADLFRSNATARGLSLEVHCEGVVPSMVLLDVIRLRQILVNLLSNAVKFTERGGVSLHLSARAGDDAAHALLVFRVDDSGIGMDASTLAGLFQRFHQADATISRRHGGSGLGLEISRNLARLMGGDITVASTPGQGSSFTLTLPAVVSPDRAAPTPVQPRDAGAALAPASGPVRALDVLVADDNAINRRFMAHALGALGHRAEFAENGKVALDKAAQRRFDVVLMDIHMPEMDGIAATRAIRALPPPHAAMPVVAVTADVMAETADLAAEAGVTAMLYKPMQKDDLARLLGALFT